MRDTFWIGVYPGMTDEMIDRMIAVVGEGIPLSI
jgi:CDP-6-deoxy-D-xylo-4-hexulose-3-dehydrase